MQHSAPNRGGSPLRGMQNRCRIEPNVSSIGETGDGSALSHNVVYRSLGNRTEAMRSGCNQQGSVCRRYRVKMDAKCNHPSYHVKRWCNVKQPALDRPRAETVNVDALRYCNGAILMPTKRPVCDRRLVEQDRSHGLTCLTEHRGCNRTHRAGGCDKRSENRISMKPHAGTLRQQMGDHISN